MSYIKVFVGNKVAELGCFVKDRLQMITSYFQEYCRCNTEDINNNIVEFKEAVQVANVELDNKIVGCGKDLERYLSNFQPF